jgi:hypothetical protein
VFENGSIQPGKMVSINCKSPKIKSIGNIVDSIPTFIDCELLHIDLAKAVLIDICVDTIAII